MKVKVLLRIKVKNSQGAEHVRCEVKQSTDVGIIRIEGGIDWYQNNSASFRAAIDTLKNAGIKKLDVYLNSPGGSTFEASEIENILNSWTGEKTLTLGALCCSSATNLILPFKKENVKAYSNITAMMHNPTTSIFDGEEKDLLSSAKLLSNYKKTYVKRMSQRMGLSETQLSNKMDGTMWLTYQDLLEYNLISGKVDKEASLPEDTAKVFNEYRYENIPSMLNRALGVELLDEEEEVVESKNEKQKTNQMKNFVVLLMASMVSIKNYLTNENASEAEVVAALTKAFSEKESKIAELSNELKTKVDKITELENKVKKHNEDMIKALLDVAQNVEKKITADTRKVYEEQSSVLGYDGLSKILNAIPARTGVKSFLEGGSGKESGKKEDEEREEPEFTKGENGERIYNSAKKTQREVYARMVVQNAKKN